MTFIHHPPYSPDLAPAIFFLFLKMKLELKGRHFDSSEEIQTKSQNLLRCRYKMTSSSASDHGNPTGIAVSTQKGTTSMGKEANIIFGKWLSFCKGIAGTFGVCL